MVLSRWIDKRIKYVFVLPALIFVLVMMVFPILYTLRLSFSQWSMGSLTAALDWAAQFHFLLVQDRRFWLGAHLCLHHHCRGD